VAWLGGNDVLVKLISRCSLALPSFFIYLFTTVGLDDHIVNIILDVTSTGVLVVQRDGYNPPPTKLEFTLVGTMNPEEGSLRPQLLDRFGLMAAITAESDLKLRRQILQTVLAFDEALSWRRNGQPETFFENAWKRAQEYKAKLMHFRENCDKIKISGNILDVCVELGKEFHGEGHRGDYLLALAARAGAAREGKKLVNLGHVRQVAPLVLQHRLPEATQLNRVLWGEGQIERLEALLRHAESKS
jgi:magnesium chelatase subunit I